MRRFHALLVVACVLLAGCSGGGPPTPATDTQPSAESPTKTLPEPLYRLELRNRDDGPVPVTIELAHLDNDSVFYERSTTLQADALRDYSSEIPEGEPFRATISVPERSRTMTVEADQGYSVSVQNESAMSVYERSSD